jgi:hypothetical protein
MRLEKDQYEARAVPTQADLASANHAAKVIEVGVEVVCVVAVVPAQVPSQKTEYESNR